MTKALSDNAAETAIAAELICESCGVKFSCSAKVGECWCYNVKLPPASLIDLRGKFNDCLCEQCLKTTREGSINE